MKAPNLGKRLKVGDHFTTTTKKMDKNRHSNCKLNADLNGPLITYEVLRRGDQRFYTKGKRRYWCEVLELVEFRTGFYCCPLGKQPVEYQSLSRGTRWYQFSYLVRILEN